MRLCTLHPKCLDARGLVALWREALLAQAVLSGRTRGYTRHPQLTRFRAAPCPSAAIGAYLRGVGAEAARAGYRFDASRIGGSEAKPGSITATAEPLEHEWAHLAAKLEARDPAWLEGLGSIARPDAHPLCQCAVR